MPVLGDKLRNSSIAASNPPAEPPIPTIGQLEFLLPGFPFDLSLARFDRDIFVLLGFRRPTGAALIDLRLGGIGPRYVSRAFCVRQQVN
jgi:hypothetical protein